MGWVQLFVVRQSHNLVINTPGECLAGVVHMRLAPLPFRAIRVTCTGSCRVSNKVSDVAWVVEEGYFKKKRGEASED
uniref:Uncharacterized protein n=1 Tax=Balaenoptera musculus TaxID=9771 RepID=A0A8C0DGT7_BALMU